VENKMSESLIKLLESKKELAQQIFQNTIAQTEAIEKKMEQDLLRLLSEREVLLGKLDELDGRIAAFPENTSDVIISMKRSIRSVFEKIVEQDLSNYKKIEELQQDVVKSSNQHAQGKKALTEGYMKQGIQSDGYFLDEKK